MSSPSPPQFLLHMELPSHRGVFILGCFEQRVTLYSQQVRALNLIHALFETGRLKQGSKVLVVGGGAAGLTAAAGAAQRGCAVTVLEKKHDVLTTFTGNTKRLLHPHLYDWPEDGWEEEQAGLPLLDWKADVAGNVAEQLRQGWEKVRQDYQVTLHCKVEKLQPSALEGPPYAFSWHARGRKTQKFDAIIVAVGFGVERGLPGIPSHSYWKEDDLDQPQWGSQHQALKVLVSGTGDGGLVDLLRLRLKSFSKLIHELLSTDLLDGVKRELRAVEKELHNGSLPAQELDSRYRALHVPQAFNDLLQRNLREDTRVVLNGREPHPVNPRASILNRFLVSRLFCREDGESYVSGDFKIKQVAERYEVTYASGEPEFFDRIIIRHGPDAALAEKNGFAWVPSADQEKLRARNQIDETRSRLWPEGAFTLHRASTEGSPAAGIQQPSPARRERFQIIGRKQEVARLVESLLKDPPTPTMVLGPPGIGKSTVTRAALNDKRVQAHYGQRMHFVQLADANTAQEVFTRIVQKLDLTNISDPHAGMIQQLSTAPTLLILDNAETPWGHDPSGTNTLFQELSQIPSLALVASLRGTQSPDLGTVPFVQLLIPKLSAEEALELFYSIAPNVPRDDPRLTELLEAQEGVALAVKLLAQAAQGTRLELTYQRWQEERTRLPELTPLRAAVRISIDGPPMTDDARRLLSVLAMCPGDVAASDIPRFFDRSAHALAILEKTALMEWVEDRSHILSPIRDYVQESLQPAPEGAKRVIDFYFGLIRQFHQRVARNNRNEAKKRLGGEIDILEGLLLRELKSETPDEAIDATLDLAYFVRFSGKGSDLPLDCARQVARKRNDLRREAQCLLALGSLRLLRRPRYDEARNLIEQAIQLFQQLGDLPSQAKCLRELGHTAVSQYELDRAVGYFQRALKLHEQFHDPVGLAYCLHGLARAARYQGRVDEARRLFQQTLEMFMEQGDTLGQAYSLRHLGELNDDVDALQRACTIFEKAGELRNLGMGLRSLGELMARRGQVVEARLYFQQAAESFQQLEDADAVDQCRRSIDALPPAPQ
jgi:tetratricopeptide (TPR) repeat protein